MSQKRLMKGSSLALIGALWYLLEWAFIIPFGRRAPAESSSVTEWAAYFSSQTDQLPFYVLGITLAIMGRLLFIAAVRNALIAYEDTHPLLDFAFASCVVAVAFETVTLAVEGIAYSIAVIGPEPQVMVAAAIQQGNLLLAELTIIPFGLFIVSTAWAMRQTRSLPAWVSWTGMAGGLGVLLSLDAGPGFTNTLPLMDMVVSISFILTLVWMIATGVVLLRPARPVAHSEVVSPA